MMANSYWMPFTSMRSFKSSPRVLTAAKGLYYYSADGKKILDAVSGLWCVNLGHSRPEITAAISETASKLDFVPAYQVSHPQVFELAEKVGRLVEMDSVFFTNSGSEAVETALKIAIGKKRLEGHNGKLYFIGRRRDFHGVTFGALAVGGIAANADPFGELYPYVERLPETYVPQRQAFSKGQPEWGAELADELPKLVKRLGPNNIAAVIIEPVAGSNGVLVPPVGYLERLAKHCADHCLPLIADEVITSCGRLGYGSACRRFGLKPQMVTLSKGLTNGTVPLGAVATREDFLSAFLKADKPPHAIEFPHGFTFSAHTLAVAAAMATLEIYEKEDIFAGVRKNEALFAELLHSLKGKPYVKDIRCLGFMGAVELEADQETGKRAFEVYSRCFAKGALVRQTADAIALAPALVTPPAEMEKAVRILGEALEETAGRKTE